MVSPWYLADVNKSRIRNYKPGLIYYKNYVRFLQTLLSAEAGIDRSRTRTGVLSFALGATR